MPERRLKPTLGIAILLAIIAGIAWSLNAQVSTLREARFDLGENIVKAARATGLPRFEASNNFGHIEYSVTALPKDVVVKFGRPGLEVGWPALFDFTLIANHNRTPDDIARQATLQLSGDLLRSHAEAQKFADDTLAQFARGKWKRYIPPWCPRVTGRSSLLDAAGAVDSSNSCPIDPAYRIPAESFALLFERPRYWMWHSGDVFARFKLSHMTIAGAEVYTGFLDFETADSVKTQAAEDEKEDSRSPAERSRDAENERRSIQIMEAAAVKRGDRLMPL